LGHHSPDAIAMLTYFDPRFGAIALLSSYLDFFMPMLVLLGAFLPPVDALFSTQGIMIALLAAYAGAMWMFLTSAPKVYTVMVSDVDIARQFYEGLLNLPVADVPLHYYYNYEQTLGAAGMDPLYNLSATSAAATATATRATDGLWYQLKKNTQLHVISGASYGPKNRQRHVCFDHDCLEDILLRVQSRRLKFKVRRTKPLNFLVKDIENRVIELVEVAN
jgi:catechol 2,3-dioxygenase-like lactoylglutathione lyase family enzyme